MCNKIKEKIKENIDTLANGGASLLGGMLSDTLIGQIAPGVTTTLLSYRQKKTEKMIFKAIEELRIDMIRVENDIKEMSEYQMDFVKNVAIPIVFENMQNEIQYDKITFIVNGLKKVISDRITDEDLILSYYDILNKLRMIDIRTLINLYKESKKMIRNYMIDRSDTRISEYDAVEIYIAKKLENMYLVDIKKTINDLQGTTSKITPDRIDISVLGTKFIEFFNICP